MKKFLIILPRQLGDVLLGTPMPFAIKESFPDAYIAWSTHPMAKQILEGHPALDKIFYLPQRPKFSHSFYKSKGFYRRISCYFNYILNLLRYFFMETRMLVNIKKEGFDVVIDVMNTPRTNIQTWASGAKKRISFKTRLLSNLCYNHLVPRSELNNGYLALTRLKLLEPLGIPLPQIDNPIIHTYIPIHEQDTQKAHQVFHSLLETTGCEQLVILSPTHRRPVRQWPITSYVELAVTLIQSSQDAVVWLCGPGELDFVKVGHQALVNRLTQLGLSPEKSQIAPLLSMRETAAFCRLCRGWIGNTNGISHMAVAGGARTIQIHGPTKPMTWTHPNRNLHRSVRRSQGCVECGLNACALAKRECLDDLTINEVFEQTRDLFYKLN